MTDAELKALLLEAAEEGAKRALAGVGLHDEEALKDVMELRTLLDSWRALKRGTLHTVGKFIAVAILALLAWSAGAGKWKVW